MNLTTQNGPAVRVRGVTLRAVSSTRWRVLDRTGRVMGESNSVVSIPAGFSSS